MSKDLGPTTYGPRRIAFGAGRWGKTSPRYKKFHPDKPLGFGTSDGWVWTRETIKLINRLCGKPQLKYNPDSKTLFSVSTRTPLYLMELAGRELEIRVITEHEIPRSVEYRQDITTLYLQILWRKIVNHNEFGSPKVGWPKETHQRKLRPIAYYETIGCASSEEWALLMDMMDLTREQGMWEMHHGKGMCVG